MGSVLGSVRRTGLRGAGAVSRVRSGRLWLLAVGLLSLGAAKAPGPPNIVLLMADDQGYGETGYAGHAQVRTPELDAMAAAGLRFDRFYAAAPLCSPTRASVMTGRHPVRSGVLSRNYALRQEEVTLAQHLREAGYRTGHFGKWHLGPVRAGSPVSPRAFGFQKYFSADRSFNLDDVLSQNGETPIQFDGEGSDFVVTEALRFAQRARAAGKPFLAVVWFGSPHQPYRATPEDLAAYGGGTDPLSRRFAEITAMDRAIGRLRRGLVELGIARNTLVWFCSDNGPPDDVRENGGLRGAKGSLGEGGLRVPGVIEWPAVVPAGRRLATVAVTSDMLPTLLDVVGIDPGRRPLDGVSLRPAIEGRPLERAGVGFWTYPIEGEVGNPPWLPAADLVGEKHPRAARVPAVFYNFRHPESKRSELTGAAAWISGPWKLRVEPAEAPDAPVVVSLYDLASDPAEERDVAAENPRFVANLKGALQRWQASVERSLTGEDYAIPVRLGMRAR